MSEYQWKAVSVVGFDELMEALERADRKGYMPDAVKEAWEGFNWKPAQQEPPTVAELVCVCGAEWEWRNRDWELVATPPAQRKPLTDEQIEKLREKTFSTGNPYCPVDSKSMRKAARAIEAAHNIKE